MDYGITKYGFALKRGDIIIEDIKSRLRAAFSKINLSDKSVNMTLVGILADPIAEIWEGLNAVYNSQYPNSADGQPLDYLCELNAIKRLGQTYSVSFLAAKGTEGTLLGTYLKVGSTGDQSVIFQASQSATITVSSTNKMIISVSNVISETEYVVTINSHTIQINSGIGATAISIAGAIHDEINVLSALVNVQASLPTVPDGTFTVISNDTDFPFIAVPDANLTITDFWTPIRSQCINVGSISANAGTLTNIITPIYGLDSIVNLKDAAEGREIETDTELRIRRYKNVRVIGAATVEAIRARMLQEVENVRQALVYENVEDYPDTEGRPAKSIECLVDGGTDADIAAKIWETKAGGIQTHGNTSFVIYDSMDNPKTINFSRPVQAYIWIRITLTVNGLLYPTDGSDQLKTGIVETALQNFGIGDDVLIQKFFCPIYSIAGVLTALVEIAKTYDLTPPVSYVTTNLDIDEDEASNFDSSRIAIIIP